MQLNTVQTLIRIELPLSDTCLQVFKYIYISGISTKTNCTIPEKREICMSV